MGYTQFNDDVFVIDCWPDTKEKENTLIELIQKVKVYNAPIILAGHHPVKPEIQKLVDYYLYDGDNDILLEKDYKEYGINSDRWSDMGNNKVTNKVKFHHDYAIWITMRNTFNFVKKLGKKYIHFLEYDNLPDEIQYRQSFMEYVTKHDAVVYEYSKDSTKEANPYCATFLFSIRTDIALELVSKINTKEEFFKNKPDRWQLEKVFYQTLKSITNDVYVSKYIANDNELNIYAAWNRNGILKNNARLQTYLCVDDYNQLHIHLISGFSEKPADKDYLVEINYGDYKKFYNLKKGEFYLDRIGTYNKGESVKVFYQGVNIFDELLDMDINEFRHFNKLTKKVNQNTKREVNVFFIDGPFVEIKEENNFLYNVQFINKKTNTIEYELTLKSNHWAKSGKKYFIDWLVKIKGIDNDFNYEYNLDLTDKRVLIAFESKSLGDSLAWMGQVERFRLKHNCKVICSTFQNELFEKQYPEIEFSKPGTAVNNINALYRLGLFYNDKREIDYSKHISDPKKEPLMKVASDILGLEYEECKPKLKKLGKKVQKRVCIAIHGTSQCKYWNNPTGWQDVTDYLKEKGYEVRLLSREENGYMGNKHPKGIVQQKSGPIIDVIKTLQESELFIGISSGLSWLSWASGTPTIIISGFTDADLEPTEDVARLINKDVCNSCWSDYTFDPGDWNWCPVNKGTDKQFECSKEITSDDVIKQINNILFKK
jgi:autotransporter strand-loop-strand O-heptosyltransferase